MNIFIYFAVLECWLTLTLTKFTADYDVYNSHYPPCDRLTVEFLNLQWLIFGPLEGSRNKLLSWWLTCLWSCLFYTSSEFRATLAMFVSTTSWGSWLRPNALLSGVSKKAIGQLQLEQNADENHTGHIIPILKSLPWLPVCHRIHFVDTVVLWANSFIGF